MKVSLVKLFVTLAPLNEVVAKIVSDSGPTFPSPSEGVSSLNSGEFVNVLLYTKQGASSIMTDILMDKDIKVNTEVKGSGIVGLSMSAESFEKLSSQSDGDNILVEVDHLQYVSKKPVHLRKLAETMPWGIPKVLQDLEFWEDISNPSGPQMAVCVADTGYDLGHEDLPTGSDVDGTDNYGSSWSNDGHGHGTHCSGTVAAIGDNGKGVPGVIPNNKGGKFKLLIGKALSDSGSGSNSGVMAAVGHCISKGAKVVSMSLGCSNCYSSASDDFYQGKYNGGVLIVAAAGNSGPGVIGYPASYDSIVSVASLTDQGSSEDPTRSGFSQTNDQIEISAPGQSVLSTLPNNNYDAWSGTSMACPHVAGVAGLVWMYFPECTNVQIRHVLAATAYPLGVAGCNIEYGYGMVQAKAAYDLLNEGSCGGELGLSDPNEAKGGCEELYGTPPPTPSPCTGPDDCNDGNSCTTDSCDAGICSNTPTAIGVVEVSITTDNYPGETQWTIVNADGDQAMAGGPYDSAGTTYTDTKDLLGCDIDYVFTITDSYGDGICCSYGDGGYTIALDGEVIAEGGNFGSSDAKNFNINAPPSPVAAPPTSPTTSSPVTPPSSPPTSSPVAPPTSPPTSSPVTPPSSPPTSSPVAPPTSPPTSSPVSPPTSSDCKRLNIWLTTDDFGYETTMEVINDNSGKTRFYSGSFNSVTTVEESICLTDGRYTFTISDSYGDGICCNNGNGSYSLTLDGETVKTGGEFGESDTVTFDVGPPGPTRAPTSAPTCLAADVSCVVGDQCCSGRCKNNKCD